MEIKHELPEVIKIFHQANEKTTCTGKVYNSPCHESNELTCEEASPELYTVPGTGKFLEGSLPSFCTLPTCLQVLAEEKNQFYHI